MKRKTLPRDKYPKREESFRGELLELINRWGVLRAMMDMLPLAKYIREKHSLWWKIKRWHYVGVRRGYARTIVQPEYATIWGSVIAEAQNIITLFSEDGESRTMTVAQSKQKEKALGLLVMKSHGFNGTYEEYKEHFKKIEIDK